MIFGNKDEIISLKTIQNLCEVPITNRDEKEKIEVKKIYIKPKITIDIPPIIEKEIKPKIAVKEIKPKFETKPKIAVKENEFKAKVIRVEKKKNQEPKIKDNHKFKRLNFNNCGDNILWI